MPQGYDAWAFLDAFLLLAVIIAIVAAALDRSGR
jgi:hypothetical protein